MSSKKIVLILIVLMVLFIFFIRSAFISLQEESYKINTYEYNNENEMLNDVFDTIKKDSESDFKFLDEISILLIDHLNKEAVLCKKEEINTIKYNEIPSNILNTNSFYLKINNTNTMIINTDLLLGDLEERIISESYKYLYLSQNNLDPFEIEYFSSKNEDIKLRYYRNMIINELIKVNSENGDLKRVKYFFDEWENYNSDNYNNVVNYDIYEGRKEYIKVKVKMKNDMNFNLYDYIDSKRNRYGFLEKEDEYKIIGMLLFEYADNNNIEVISELQNNKNLYKYLLYKVPLIKCEADVSYNEFEINYNKWLDDLPTIIDNNFDEFKNNNEIDFTFTDLIAEKYDYTFKINSNYFIYFNYKARTNKNIEIEKDYVIAYISPNTINYYLVK